MWKKLLIENKLLRISFLFVLASTFLILVISPYRLNFFSDGVILRVYNKNSFAGFEVCYDREAGRFEIWETGKNVHGAMVERRFWPNGR